MDSVSNEVQGHRAAGQGGQVTSLYAEGTGRHSGESWRRDVQQMMLMVRRLAGYLKSESLALLIDQLEQTGYRIVACRPVENDPDEGRDGAGFVEVARSCMREMEYQLLLAREANLPGRQMHEPMQSEFREIRRVLAKCIQRVRNR